MRATNERKQLPSLRSFLETTRISLRSGENITIALGDETGDLGSVVSSLVYSYLESTKGTGNGAIVPVVNMPKEDLILKRDSVYVLKQCQMDGKDELFFIDDPMIAGILERDTTSLVLINHNRLAVNQRKWEGKVCGIIDHHPDEGLYMNAKSRDIRPVGSCATLVTHQWNTTHYNTVDDQQDVSLALAKLLLSSILIDTVKLDKRCGCTTPEDEEAVDFLLPLIMPYDCSFNGVPDYYNAVFAAHCNVADLANRDLLRRDHEQWGDKEGCMLGFSSIPWSLSGWIKRSGAAEVLEAMKEYAKEKKLDVLAVIFTYLDPGLNTNPVSGCPLRGELSLYAPSTNTLSKVASSLAEKMEVSSLDDAFPEQYRPTIRVFRLADGCISRKQVAPLLHSIACGSQ